PAGGGLCAMYAASQAHAFLSAHIGSGPGVAGLSGMQVNAFVPLRSVRIVAFFATLAGAARIALAISSASVGAFLSAACNPSMASSIVAAIVKRYIDS